jgi:DNA-binding transcriptional LysR family regulator
MLRCDSDLAQLALLRSRAGIGICQTAIAGRDPDLVRLLPDMFSLALTTYVVMREGLKRSLRCRTAYDGLVAGLRGCANSPGLSDRPAKR